MLHTFFHSLSTFYKEHLWIKISALLGLVVGACCIIALSGGLPPWAWRFSLHVLAQLPALWAAQGAALLPALLGLLLISLSLLIVWIVLVFLLLKVGGQIWSDVRARQHRASFASDLAEAEFLAQEQADWRREQDEYEQQTLPAYMPERAYQRPVRPRPTPAYAGNPQREKAYTTHVTRDSRTGTNEIHGASTARVRRTVPLIPPNRPVQEPAARQQFRPMGLPQRNTHAPIPFTQAHAPRRLHVVPHFSATATVEDDLLPESFHHQRHTPPPSTFARHAAYAPQEDENVSSVWGERQQRYAEQDTRPAQDWWEEQDEEDQDYQDEQQDEQEELAEHDTLQNQDEEDWDDNLGTQPIEDIDDIDNLDDTDNADDVDNVDDVDTEGNEEEDWQQEAREENPGRYNSHNSYNNYNSDNTTLPEEDWGEEDEDEMPTQEDAADTTEVASRRQTPLTRSMLEEEMDEPLEGDAEDTQVLSDEIAENAEITNTARDVRLVIGIGLDPGLSRKHAPNEDSIYAIEGMRVTDRGPQPAGLFIVADGMGGHANGREASHTVVNSMSDAIIPSLLRETCDRSKTEEETLFLDMLKQGAHQANLALYQKNREARSSMGTTLTAALIVNLTAYVVNVGDSRTYLYRPEEGLMQVTRDHSVVARMVEVGAITKDEVYTHPKRNQIYRCLGEHATVDIDTFSVPVNVGDILLLCSDGLWEMVRDHDLERIIDESGNPSQMSSKLVQAALQGGGADNIGSIVVALADASE